jgi:hypothetical protein
MGIIDDVIEFFTGPDEDREEQIENQRRYQRELAHVRYVFEVFGKMTGKMELRELGGKTKSILKNFMNQHGYGRKKKSCAAVAFADSRRDEDTLLALLRNAHSEEDIDPQEIANTCAALAVSEKIHPKGNQFFDRVCDALELNESQKAEIKRHKDVHEFQCEKSINGVGSGFIASPDGFIVTCAHVVKNARKVFVKFKNLFPEAKVVAFDDDRDVALLKVEVEHPYAKLPFLRVGDEIPDIGTDILTYGYPRPWTFGYDPNATSGVVQRKAGMNDEPGYITIDCKIFSGNSGGPVVSRESKTVVGIVSHSRGIFCELQEDFVDNLFNMAVDCETIVDFLAGCDEYEVPDDDEPESVKAEGAVVPVFYRKGTEEEEDMIDVVIFADESERNKLYEITQPRDGTGPQVLCDHMDWLHAKEFPEHDADKGISYKRILTSVADRIDVSWPSVPAWDFIKVVEIERLIAERLFKEFPDVEANDHPALAERILEEWGDPHGSYWKRLAAGVVYVYHIGHYVDHRE